MRVVICGGGVIGACTAYFLGQRGAEAVVVERTGVACAASGKSGGFLALDWCDGTPLAALARRSFALHAELAAAFGSWDYRRLDTLAVAASARRSLRATGGLPGWVAREAALQQQLGTTRTTAQIHPERFTRGMMDAAIAAGARLQIGEVTGLLRHADRVAGVLVDGAPLGADAVVIALGPWSLLACAWLPLPMVYGLKGHSVVLRTGVAVTPHALFVEYEAEDGAAHAPEVFPRPDGTTYVCGLSSEAPLPLDPAAVATDGMAQAKLRAMIRGFAPGLADAEAVAAQACYRPVTRDGLPLMGRVSGVAGAYVATGHSVWGMLNGPATGETMAELIADGRTSLDIAAFDPARLPALPADAVRA
ncbi:MAG TPA: FAD-dependent oxidoreductase [Geminicoccaceae bacterium]|nr:FAD-dependent oxidoreductase [Geminicoccaceae bacterium]